MLMRSTSGFRMYLATPTTYTDFSVAGRRPVIYSHPRPEATHARMHRSCQHLGKGL